MIVYDIGNYVAAATRSNARACVCVYCDEEMLSVCLCV